MYGYGDSRAMYDIRVIRKVEHQDGSVEIIPSDTTIALIADNLQRMSVDLPLTEDDDDAIWEFIEGLEVFIGQDEAQGIHHPQSEKDQVGLALDEFNPDDGEYIDYDALSARVASYIDGSDR